MIGQTTLLSAALAVALTAALGVLLLQPETPVEPPYALWQNGVLVKVRNCEQPQVEDTMLLCASYYCEQAVSRRLVSAQLTTLTTEVRKRLPGGQLKVAGRIDYYQMRSPSLPSGYQCLMRRHDRAQPQLLFRRRP